MLVVSSGCGGTGGSAGTAGRPTEWEPVSWSCDPGSRSASADGERAPAVGVQFHGTWSDYTDPERERVLDVVGSTGMSWVRIDAVWSALQPAAGRWDERELGRLDTAVGMAHQRELNVLVTLLNTPGWAGGGEAGLALPRRPSAYGDVIAALADRYAGSVGAWEVWNEPNSEDFAEGADPAAYAALLKAAYPAVKGADSDALVVFGGTQYNDDEFVAGAYEAGAQGFFDVMATHPYPAPSDAAPDADDDGSPYSLGHVAAIKRIMDRNGDGDLPVWFTEFGWSTHQNTGGEQGYERGVSAQQQGEYLIDTLRLVRSRLPYVDHVFWYAERDRQQGGSQIAHFGLLTVDLEPKPAAEALACYLGR